mgnify:CR=1 FL=1
MNRARRARIVATLGPASRAPGTVKALAQAGADVFRLNFSHGSHEDHAAALKAVRGAELAVKRPLGVLADLQGPKLRLGKFRDTAIDINPGDRLRLDLDPTPGDVTRVSMPHPEIFQALRTGIMLLLDDGRVRLKVVDRADDWADVEVESGLKLSDRKGVAVPQASIPISALTPKDREDLAFALRLGVDWVALSFVQRAEDMAELRRLVDGKAACLAKIEKPQALEQLDSILDYCDGVMVARGDLGVELDPEEVPVAQKRILRAARQRGVPAIVATQMLESMTSAPAPTRAEASDVANAVYEGADALMLSAETASGDYPLEAVGIMSRIIERVERDPLWPGLMDAEHAGGRGAIDGLYGGVHHDGRHRPPDGAGTAAAAGAGADAEAGDSAAASSGLGIGAAAGQAARVAGKPYRRRGRCGHGVRTGRQWPANPHFGGDALRCARGGQSVETGARPDQGASLMQRGTGRPPPRSVRHGAVQDHPPPRSRPRAASLRIRRVAFAGAASRTNPPGQ